MENTTCPSLFSDLMSYWTVGADVLLFKRYGFMDFLSVCWISALTLSEQGFSDSRSLSWPSLSIFTPSLYTYRPHSPIICRIWVWVHSSCPHFHPNFSCNDNTPNNSPNPSMLCCSITVFRRMGLGAEMAEGRGGGRGRMVEWVELKGEGGKRRENSERKRIRGRRDCFLLPWKAADEETGIAAVGKSQIACHQPTAHWSV